MNFASLCRNSLAASGPRSASGRTVHLFFRKINQAKFFKANPSPLNCDTLESTFQICVGSASHKVALYIYIIYCVKTCRWCRVRQYCFLLSEIGTKCLCVVHVLCFSNFARVQWRLTVSNRLHINVKTFALMNFYCIIKLRCISTFMLGFVTQRQKLRQRMR